MLVMPRVSIGLPVYNGANYLREALDAILSQTYEDFELIISDNASTDATGEICRELAASDSRIRYIRHETNSGAAPNFNFVFREARGEFFKWAAHDDLIAPEFIETCVAALDADTSAVLAFPMVYRIDETGRMIAPYQHPLKFDSRSAGDRFSQLVQFHRFACYEIFGLIRTGALKETALIGSYSNGDGVLLAHLGLMGRFALVPKPLFFPRRHPDQSQRYIRDKRRYDEWFDRTNAAKRRLPYWRMIGEYEKAVRAERMGAFDKLVCYACLARQTVLIWRKLGGDVKRAALGGPGGSGWRMWAARN
jgi:glycosyltransferase involved in cell wall biosynthesis